MTGSYDAIVVGGGHNGLVTAVYLAREGWETLVLERNDSVGGAVRSAELTRDGFVHDCYATNQNLFLGSPVWEDLQEELQAHGLSFAHSEKPYCNVFPDGTALRVYQDTEATRSELREHNAADASGWTELQAKFETFERTLLPLYGTPLPSYEAVKQLASAARELGYHDLMELFQIVSSSTRELGDVYFDSEEAKALVAPWGMHLDYGPDVSGGAMFPFIETFTDMNVGISIVEGGASNLVEALAGVCEDAGGTVRTNAEVDRITVDKAGRATGVELTDGERIHAREAVVANLTPTVLFDDLIADPDIPPGVSEQVDDYTYGPGTMMIHLALSDLPDWEADEEISEFAYVHIGPYVDDLAETAAAIRTERDDLEARVRDLERAAVSDAIDDFETVSKGDTAWRIGVLDGVDPNDAGEAAKDAVSDSDVVVAVGGENRPYLVVAAGDDSGVHAGSVVDDVTDTYGGGGGGGPPFAQGGGLDASPSDVLDAVRGWEPRE